MDIWEYTLPKLSEGEYACYRQFGIIYLSKSFQMGWAPDEGKDARFIDKVLRPCTDQIKTDDEKVRKTVTMDVHSHKSDSVRYQIQLRIVEKPGRCTELRFIKINENDPANSELLIRLEEDDAESLIEMLKSLPAFPVTGPVSRRVDDAILTELSDADISKLCQFNREDIRKAIETDENAKDVKALAARKKVVEEFGRLLNDQQYFHEKQESFRGPEAVWQNFFEENQWILGTGLDIKFLQPWDENRLEQTVSGNTNTNSGKRVDALLKVPGYIQSAVFVEIKTPETHLGDPQ
ncbi:MAG: DUF4263 domain-containing protein [Bifidobacterium sp.]|nr:DUF4263 domain-containing protein [Bifidobacterium sp.]